MRIRKEALRCLPALLLFAPLVFGDTILEPDATLPPADAVYTTADTCISTICLGGITISDFSIDSSSIVGSNQITDTTAVLDANVFANNAGSPGALVGSVALTGPVDFEFFGRTDLNETGTFSGQITSVDFTGTFNGHTAEIILNPADSSTGTTTVEVVGETTESPIDHVTFGAGEDFQINSFFDVFTELSIDSGAFVPGPERTLTLSSAPEPGTMALLGAAALLGMFGLRLKALK